ncbi:MAG TPA: immunoglobulin domain-containing protein, partial [Verrucomicrobiae bacterium]|nr:immunoglobulin domain-containing protein [Verrucomicrobiae bacterium]
MKRSLLAPWIRRAAVLGFCCALWGKMSAGEPGRLDPGFHPDPKIADMGASIAAVAVQPDGKIVLGFPPVDAFFAPPSPALLARLNADGSLDAGYHPAFVRAGGFYQSGGVILTGVSGFVALPDGKLLLRAAAGSSVDVVRLNPDGSLDASFDRATLGGDPFSPRLSDGRVLQINGATVQRINANGSADPSFQIKLSDYYSSQPVLRQEIFSVAAQADDKVIVAAEIVVNALNLESLVRYRADGSLDDSFVTTDQLPSGPDYGLFRGCFGRMLAVAVQPDGKIVAVGKFTGIGGVNYPNVARFYGDPTPPSVGGAPGNQVVKLGGTATFQVTVEGAPPFTYQWQFQREDLLGATNASLILTNITASQIGNYTVVIRNAAGATTSPAATLQVSDLPHGVPGALDWNFNPDPRILDMGDFAALGVQSDGKVLVTFNPPGAAPTVITRLNTDGSLDSSFRFNGQWTNENSHPWINQLRVQPDDKILVNILGNLFFDGTTATGLARLNADGTLDRNFDTNSVATGPFTPRQSSGKSLRVGSQEEGVVRLNANGSVDPSFKLDYAGYLKSDYPGWAFTGHGVISFTVLPDDSLVVSHLAAV